MILGGARVQTKLPQDTRRIQYGNLPGTFGAFH